MQPKSQPPLTRANAPTAFALRNIADRKARGRLRAAAAAEAVGKGELEWLDAEGWRYQLERPPVVTISPKDTERAAATVDLRAWDARNTLIFRDRIHAWDGFPVLVPDGTEHEEALDDGTTQRVDNFRESPLEAARSDLAHTVRAATKGGKSPWVKAKPGTVDTFYAGTADDSIYSETTTSYSDARAGTGDTLAVRGGTDTTWFIRWQFAGGQYLIDQAALEFDTSSIDDGEAVSGAVLSIYQAGATSNADGWGSIYARSYDFGATITAADYRPTDGTSAGDTLLAQSPRADWSANGYKVFTSEAAFSGAVNLTGPTRLYLVMSNAEAATAPTGTNRVTISFANTASTTQDPKLVVTHAAATPAFRRTLLGVGV